MLSSLKKEIRKAASVKRAKANTWFFKTGKGEYGYGDRFLGLTVPQMRQITSKFQNEIGFADIKRLLRSEYHEERLIALLILVRRFQLAGPKEQKVIYNFYLAHTKYINNWDLVDASAHKIVGEYLQNRNRAVLYKLAKSKNLWERRIALVSTFQFIKFDQFRDSLKLAQLLLHDKHDLVQKAAGWMLREIGKKNELVLVKFLDQFHTVMPRTTLRYAIERFPKRTRSSYMKRD